MNVTVYTKPDCQPCKATKRLMNKEGIPYTEEEVNDANREIIRALGHMSAPIIVIKNNEGQIVSSWAGFRPDEIKAINIRT